VLGRQHAVVADIDPGAGAAGTLDQHDRSAPERTVGPFSANAGAMSTGYSVGEGNGSQWRFPGSVFQPIDGERLRLVNAPLADQLDAAIEAWTNLSDADKEAAIQWYEDAVAQLREIGEEEQVPLTTPWTELSRFARRLRIARRVELPKVRSIAAALRRSSTRPERRRRGDWRRTP